MQVKVTLTLKEEELKKIMDETGLTTTEGLKGYFMGKGFLEHLSFSYSKKWDIGFEVDTTDEFNKKLREIFISAYDEELERLSKPEVKEVKRIAKPGEWIKITTDESATIDSNVDGEECYKRGDIFKVYKMHSVFKGSVYCELNTKVKDSMGNLKNNVVFDNGNLEIEPGEYVVLENYEPPKKPEVKEVKRQAKPGEWIKITNAYATHGQYKNGDVLKVKNRSLFDTGLHVTEFEFPDIVDNEYVVLENYEPEEGEKK